MPLLLESVEGLLEPRGQFGRRRQRRCAGRDQVVVPVRRVAEPQDGRMRRSSPVRCSTRPDARARNSAPWRLRPSRRSAPAPGSNLRLVERRVRAVPLAIAVQHRRAIGCRRAPRQSTSDADHLADRRRCTPQSARPSCDPHRLMRPPMRRLRISARAEWGSRPSRAPAPPPTPRRRCPGGTPRSASEGEPPERFPHFPYGWTP